MKRKEAIGMAVDAGNDAYKRGVIAGRKEVCDWIMTYHIDKNHRVDKPYWTGCTIPDIAIQTKLEEWGIK
jgi:hypothetical protein